MMITHHDDCCSNKMKIRWSSDDNNYPNHNPLCFNDGGRGFFVRAVLNIHHQ